MNNVLSEKPSEPDWRNAHLDQHALRKGLDVDPTGERLLVGIDNLAWCMDISPTSIRRWAARGEMPAPLKIGGAIRWDVRKIRDWIDSGCPHIRTGPTECTSTPT